MILQPVLPLILDHGELNGLADDDHADYLSFLSNLKLSHNGESILFVSAFFIFGGCARYLDRMRGGRRNGGA